MRNTILALFVAIVGSSFLIAVLVAFLGLLTLFGAAVAEMVARGGFSMVVMFAMIFGILALSTVTYRRIREEIGN